MIRRLLGSPSRRLARLSIVAVPLVGIIAGAGLVYQASYSAFSASTTNPTSNWASGTVALADDDSNGALFSVTGLKPGSSGSRCIVVTSSGSLPSVVKLYATASSYTQTAALGDTINLTITEGTGSTFAGSSATPAATCTGFTPLSSGSGVFAGSLTQFNAAGTTYGTVNTTTVNTGWSPTGSAAESRTFQFSWSIPSSATAGAGGTAALGFTWETQSS